MIEKTTKLVVSLGGAGFLKPASGTWGTLASMPIAWIIASCFSPSVLIIASFIVFLIGWYFTYLYENQS
ncbi:MAG: phosphatidylglycerophosphatase A, partial [Alphaproteobacteria bacterium]